MEAKRTSPVPSGLEVAVIGMAGRFPGASNIAQFWRNLEQGIESISFYSEQDLKESGVDAALLGNPAYVKGGGALADKDLFDAHFFGYIPAEAQMMDPQMRVFHEVVWEALEDAGHDPAVFKGLIGLYAGAAHSFGWEAMVKLSGIASDYGQFEIGQLTDKDFLCTRISYKLHLDGPSVALQSACSTSLVAVHMACRALLTGECGMAVAGGVTILSSKSAGYLYQEGMTLSPDGHCRAFDAGANGTVSGEGAGAVVLRRLKDSLAGRDRIYAVVKSTALNNDGVRKVGYAAPSVEGQAQVIGKALRLAKVDVESIGFVEAHGTGTPLGDPVEVEALKLAFATDKRRYCALGSVKTNVGHLNSAAGVTGFIKAVLSIYHRCIPPSLHFQTPNPKIDFDSSPFYVNTEARRWQDSESPLLAGVSSFGIGGTNAHAVLQEAPPKQSPAEPSSRQEYLLLLSARSEAALDEMGVRLEMFFEENPHVDPADVAFTLANGRRHFSQRRAIVFSSLEEATRTLAGHRLGKAKIAFSDTGDRQCTAIFMFPGLGAHYPGMCRGIYGSEPVFKRELDLCLDHLETLGVTGLKWMVEADDPVPAEFEDAAAGQAMNFCVSYALARLLIHWGVKPSAMIGYSFGEYTAAAVSGVLTPQQALRLIVSRAGFFPSLPPGKMLSVPLTLEHVSPMLSGSLSPAVDNGPSVIVSGTCDDIDALALRLKEKRLMCMEVPNPYPLHCPLVEPALHPWRAAAGNIAAGRPQIPYISNVSGTWISDSEAQDPDYWRLHLKSTVRFADGVRRLLELPDPVFVEVGPGRDLNALLHRFQENENGLVSISTLRPRELQADDRSYLLRGMARLWRAGIGFDWGAFWEEWPGRRMSLPTYPFQRQRYWIEREELEENWNRLTGGARLTGKKEIDRWFYAPQWSRVATRRTRQPECHDEALWAVCVDADQKDSFADVILCELEAGGRSCIKIHTGCGDAAPDIGERLGREVASRNKGLCHVVFICNPASFVVSDDGERINYRGFFHLVNLARGLTNHCPDTVVKIAVVTRALHDVTGEETLRPEQALVLGPVRVIPREYPSLRCCNIDLPNAGAGILDDSGLARICLREFQDGFSDAVVAYRGQYRWRQIYEPFPIEDAGDNQWLRSGDVVLLTGGLGGIGFEVALHLAKRYQARLALTGRRELSAHGEMADKILQLQEAGSEVMYEAYDVCDPSATAAALNRVIDRFGALNGVIHIAGVADYEGIIQKRDNPSGSMAVMDPKVRGVWSLDQALQDLEPDFVILFSSVASILAPFGQAAYTTGNAYLDAMAAYHSRDGRTRWLSIAWDVWRDTGMAAEARKRSDLAGKPPEDEGMLPAQAIEALERVMGGSSRLPLVAVFSQDLDAHLRHLDEVTAERRQERDRVEEIDSGDDRMRERPELSSHYAAPESESEEAMARVWERFFGVKPVGIDDDFFELGGDSLKAMTLSARIHKTMNVRIPLAQFFKTFTIRGFCSFIADRAAEEYNSIRPAAQKEYYALSSAQKRLYILQRMEPESVAYNMPTILSLNGSFDRELWQEVFRRLIDRHEIFRASFHLIEGVPKQKIDQLVDFELEYADLAATSGDIDEYSSEARALIAGFVRPFFLDDAPLLRAAAARLGEGRHILMVDMHHIISDLVTIEMFVSEFMTILGGGELQPLSILYKDYCEWQQSSQVQELLQRQERFWREVFAPLPPLLELPLDFPRPPVQSFAGASRSMIFDEEMTARIKNLSAQQDVTMYMFLMALTAVWLARLSGSEDIVVGTPVSARRHADLERCMGLLVNMLALRNFPRDELPFEQFLQQVKTGALEAFDNQEYPFEDLVEVLKIPRDVSRNPLCDVVLVYQEAMDDGPFAELSSGGDGLSMRHYQRENASSKFDITLTAIKMDQRLFVRLEYCTRLFEAASIDRFIGYFNNLTLSALTNPSVPLSDIEFLPEWEKQELLSLLNRGAGDYPAGETIVSKFQQVAFLHADRIAVLEPDGGQVTYGELDRRARGLAGTLLQMGLAEEAIVALLLEPSAMMITAILGILYAGCCYLPIDPNYPEARIDFILNDSFCRLHVTGSSSCLNLEHAAWNGADSDHTPPDISPRQLAYIIYTSGTTGRPKGVMVQHDNVVQLFFGSTFPFDFGAADTWTMFHSYSFDFSVWEMYGALLFGGRLLMVPGLAARDPGSFSNMLAQYGVTVLNQTPSAFYPLAERMLVSNCRHRLRWIVFGGEALAPGRLDAFHNAWEEVKLVNMFGITETTVHVTFRRIGRREISAGSSDIGKPLDTLKGTVTNRSGRLTPLGAVGELLVGGAGVARGYLNRPALTDEKFIPHPYDSSYRVYRSGDLVRLKKDGNLEYLGRADHQVKIRGYRIELGEIEAQLLNHDSVKQAVVLVRNLGDGNHGIVGYIEASAGIFLDNVREALGCRLPAYMVPAHLVLVDKIPLTPNGKIDRRSLLAMPITRERPLSKNSGWQNHIQRTIGDIWRDVIAVDDVDLLDNFFDIGGNSLTIIQVGSRIREELGIDVPVMTLFEHPTIQSLAHFLQSSIDGEEQDTPLVDKREAKKIAEHSRRLQQEKRRKGRKSR